MLIKELFEKQRKLDNYILDNLQLREKKVIAEDELITSKVLGLFVEITEFMSAPESARLEEYADVLHFIFAIGNFYNIDYKDTDFNEEFLICEKRNMPIDEVMPTLFMALGNLANASRCFKYWSINKEIDFITLNVCYSAVLGLIMIIGADLGYSAEEILAAYEKKMQENYDRQTTNY